MKTNRLLDMFRSKQAAVAGWMSQDTWFSAAEALAAGLCTAVLPLRQKP